jgi:hypothetical protein
MHRKERMSDAAVHRHHDEGEVVIDAEGKRV